MAKYRASRGDGKGEPFWSAEFDDALDAVIACEGIEDDACGAAGFLDWKSNLDSYDPKLTAESDAEGVSFLIERFEA